jgi:hypothetical protein
MIQSKASRSIAPSFLVFPAKEPVIQSVFITYPHAHHAFPAKAGSHLSADETSPDRGQGRETHLNSVPYRTLDPGFRRESEGAKCEVVTVFSNMPIGLQARRPEPIPTIGTGRSLSSGCAQRGPVGRCDKVFASIFRDGANCAVNHVTESDH